MRASLCSLVLLASLSAPHAAHAADQVRIVSPESAGWSGGAGNLVEGVVDGPAGSEVRVNGYLASVSRGRFQVVVPASGNPSTVFEPLLAELRGPTGEILDRDRVVLYNGAWPGAQALPEGDPEIGVSVRMPAAGFQAIEPALEASLTTADGRDMGQVLDDVVGAGMPLDGMDGELCVMLEPIVAAGTTVPLGDAIVALAGEMGLELMALDFGFQLNLEDLTPSMFEACLVAVEPTLVKMRPGEPSVALTPGEDAVVADWEWTGVSADVDVVFDVEVRFKGLGMKAKVRWPFDPLECSATGTGDVVGTNALGLDAWGTEIDGSPLLPASATVDGGVSTDGDSICALPETLGLIVAIGDQLEHVMEDELNAAMNAEDGGENMLSGSLEALLVTDEPTAPAFEPVVEVWAPFATAETHVHTGAGDGGLTLVALITTSAVDPIQDTQDTSFFVEPGAWLPGDTLRRGGNYHHAVGVTTGALNQVLRAAADTATMNFTRSFTWTELGLCGGGSSSSCDAEAPLDASTLGALDPWFAGLAPGQLLRADYQATIAPVVAMEWDPTGPEPKGLFFASNHIIELVDVATGAVVVRIAVDAGSDDFTLDVGAADGRFEVSTGVDLPVVTVLHQEIGSFHHDEQVLAARILPLLAPLNVAWDAALREMPAADFDTAPEGTVEPAILDKRNHEETFWLFLGL